METDKPKAPGRSLPDGVTRCLIHSLPNAVGLENCTTSRSKNEIVDEFMLNPLSRQLPNGFGTQEPWSGGRCPEERLFATDPVPVRAQLMTRRKKPVVAYFVADKPGSEVIVFAIRGDRKNDSPLLFKLEADIVWAFASALYVTEPKNVCNVHPWTSSIAVSFAKHYKCGKAGVPLSYALSPLEGKRAIVVVMPPPLQAIETVMHNLAIENENATSTEIEAHVQKWTQESTKASMPNREEILGVLTDFLKPLCLKSTDPSLVCTDPVQIRSPRPAKAKKGGIVAEEGNEDDAPNRLLTTSESANVTVKKKKKNSTFIGEAKQASSKEDEREELETEVFQQKQKRIAESDADEDEEDASSEDEDVKKTNKRKQRDSDNESELSQDDEDSDDQESDDDDDSEESDDEQSDSGSRQSEKSDLVDGGSKKRSRLVKTSELNSSDTRRTTPSGKNSTKASRQTDTRKAVSSQALSMLDAVEGCTAIPVAQTERVSEIVARLRAGFKDYSHRGDKFLVEDCCSIYTDCTSLCLTLVNALNAGLTPQQLSNDANVTRRLAVNGITALSQLIPALQTIHKELNEAVKAVSDVQATADNIAQEFKSTASRIVED